MILEQILKELKQEVYRLHARWESFNALFSRDTLVVLNRQRYRSFFIDVQRLMVNDLLLTIARLRDPAKSCGLANFSLAGVLEACKGRVPDPVFHCGDNQNAS